MTGSSSGLGPEFALALAERGYPILAVARRGECLRALADEVEASGGRLEPFVADLATRAGVELLLARARPSSSSSCCQQRLGVAAHGSFASASAERERGLVRLNVVAIIALTRELLPQLLARGRGGINVASQMAFQPMPYFASYAASKAFVLSFSEALAQELRGTGVRVTAVAPGFVSTEFTEVAQRRARAPLPTPQDPARGRVCPPGARGWPHGQGRRPLLRLPQLRRALCAVGRPSPDDGPRPAAGPAVPSFVGEGSYGRSS